MNKIIKVEIKINIRKYQRNKHSQRITKSRSRLDNLKNEYVWSIV